MHQQFGDMFEGSEFGIRFRTYGRIDEVGAPMISAPAAAPVEPAAAEPVAAAEAPAAPVSDLEAESAAKAVQPLPEEPPTQAEAGASELGTPPVAGAVPAPAAEAPELPATAHEAVRQDKQADAKAEVQVEAEAPAAPVIGVEASAPKDAEPTPSGTTTDPVDEMLDRLPTEQRESYKASRDRAIDAWMPKSAPAPETPASEAPASNFISDAMDQLRRMVEELSTPKPSESPQAELQRKLDAEAQDALLDKLQHNIDASVDAWR